MEPGQEETGTTQRLSAIVLAGGQSSRMGQDKALIPIQGTPLLQQVCEVALQCAAQVYVVTPWPERYQHLLPPTYEFIQEVPLPDEQVQGEDTWLSHGPLVGFAQGLAQIQTNWVLLLACDLPRLEVTVLQTWAAALKHVPPEAIALLPHQDKGWDPLCGFYRRNCLKALDDFIAQGGRSFQRWLAQQPVQELPITDAEMLFNCNTPEDLAKLLSFPSKS